MRDPAPFAALDFRAFDGVMPRRIVPTLLLLATAGTCVEAHAQTRFERVSVSSAGAQANASSGSSLRSAISADGRFVAFDSAGSNLVANDTNGVRDIFIRDLVNNVTERVSLRDAGQQSDQASDFPSISADGRYVAFVTRAALVSNDTNGQADLYVRDRTAQTTILASEGLPDLRVIRGLISADGRVVAYNAGNILFVRKLSSGAVDGLDGCELEAISDDGRKVLANCIGAGLVLTDTTYGDIVGPIPGAGIEGVETGADVSADGRFVVFATNGRVTVHDTNNRKDVWLYDTETRAYGLISTSFDGVQGNGDSFAPAISADGRFIAYLTRATNLVAGDTNGTVDLMVFDRVQGLTSRASAMAGGIQPNGDIGFPKLSSDGSRIVVGSAATNLVPTDTNGTTDVFVAYWGAPVGGPRVSIGDASAFEGSPFAPSSITFPVTLSQAAAGNVTVSYWTQRGSAVGGVDYVSERGMVRIPAGAMGSSINVLLIGDVTPEPSRSFTINLVVPNGATIQDRQGVGRIVNDDFAPLVGVFSVSPVESTLEARERVRYRVEWTVPEGGWRSLDTLELRFGEAGHLLWLRFDEATGLLSAFNPSSRTFGPGFELGSAAVLRSTLATVHLKDSRLIAPPGSPTVVLELTVAFDRSAAGAEHPIQIRARNDAGQIQGFEPAAVLNVVVGEDR